MNRLILVGLLLGSAFAGCLDSGDDVGENGNGIGQNGGLLSVPAPIFSAPQIIDDVRAGGEPVIAILQDGAIIISSHPGWTHYHPGTDPAASSELLTPANVQSYVWRSQDGGETFQHLDTVSAVPNIPRSAALGVSDPEWTVLADGTICGTDLLALTTSSVSCSRDNGDTWLPGNPVASGGPNDRQWLASLGQELFFTANYFADHHIQVSTDYGLTWERRGDVPCSQDLIGNANTGSLIVGCTRGVAVSEDGGNTWEVRNHDYEGNWGGQRVMAEPVIDAAGNVWIVGWEGERSITIFGSPDEGKTWPFAIPIGSAYNKFAANNPHDIAPTGNGTFIWPWLSAGSEGRFAVSWIGKYDEAPSSSSSGPWFIFSAFVANAHTTNPEIQVVSLTPEPMHIQPICQSGTTCQVSSMAGDESGDRRLGDFFESTIDAQGMLHVAWANTAAEPEDVVGHVQYARQTGGFPLLVPGDIGKFMPTQG